MTNVSEWSISAGSNNNAPPDGWPEGMLPGKVNDCARENMAATAKWFQDSNGTLITAGTGNAFTLATNSVHTSLTDIPLLVFRTDHANTGAATLNVDGLGAKSWHKNTSFGDYASGEIVSGKVYVLAYNSTSDDFFTVGPAIDNASAIPTGTAMLFVQTSAPTGWTKSVTDNDKALRLVSGTASSGGTTAFTSVFTSRTIALENLPSDDVDYSDFGGDVSPSINNGSSVVRSPGGFDQTDTSGNDNAKGLDNATAVTSTITLNDGGVFFSGAIHLGGDDVPMDFAVQYVDVIKATKD